MNTKESSSGLFEISPRTMQTLAFQSVDACFPRQITSTSSDFRPPEMIEVHAGSENTVRKMFQNIFAAVYFDLLSPHGEFNSRWVEPSRILLMQKALRGGKISISPDLIKPREKASESSLVAPSGFLLAWLEASSDDLGDAAF